MEHEVFNSYSKYYNLLYADKNYSLEVDYIDKQIKKHSPRSETVLEYGSGTGGHGLLLQDLGYQIEGIERSEEMAKIARDKGYKCHVSDITNFESTSKFDVCLALFHVISYINSNEDLINLFTKTRKILNEDGIFMFDVWFSPAVIHQRPEVRVKRVNTKELEVTRIAQPESSPLKNVVSVNYQVFIKEKKSGQYFEIHEAHHMRHFSIPEINFLATQTGFSILKVEEFLTGKTPSNDTWGVNFILQAK